ncbi:MAG: hypothetical protein OCD76_13865 [Reichenbachiella sp.]
MKSKKPIWTAKTKLRLLVQVTLFLCMKHLLVNSAYAQDINKSNNEPHLGYYKVLESKIDTHELQFATGLAENIMTTRKMGGYYPLTEEEADTKMIAAFNEIRQKQSYVQLKLDLGDFESLSFSHLMRSNDSPYYNVYRYKAQFESWKEEFEIRIVLNGAGKLDGFWTRPWKDQL